jgi:site-specific recombinase XerD
MSKFDVCFGSLKPLGTSSATDFALYSRFMQDGSEKSQLTVADVSTQSGDIRRETKLDAQQTKGSKERAVILSEWVRKEIGSFLKTQPKRDHDAPLIASQRNGRRFTNVTLSMLFKEIYETAGIRTSSIREDGLSRHASMKRG